MFHYVTDDWGYYHFDINRFKQFVHNNRDKIVTLDEYLKSEDQSNLYVLTFDDGTIDHYKNVYPVLKQYGIKGVFSICDNIADGSILIIQKIHYILAKMGVDEVFNRLCEIGHYQPQILLNTYKTKENAIKKLLQKELSRQESNRILDKLCEKYNITLNFEDIYMNMNMVEEMASDGQIFAYHTKNHRWLGDLKESEQLVEMSGIGKFVEKYHIRNILTLPYGDCNATTIEICKKLHIDRVITIMYNDGGYYVSREDCNTIK